MPPSPVPTPHGDGPTIHCNMILPYFDCVVADEGDSSMISNGRNSPEQKKRVIQNAGLPFSASTRSRIPASTSAASTTSTGEWM